NNTGGNNGGGTHNNTDAEHIGDSVGNGGANKAVDVRIVQDLLTRVSDRDGGSSNISVDGQNGPKTIAAIRKFQRANELTESGLVRKDGGTATLLYIQSGVDEVQ
ncbi:MAG TPA: peptidoglycan-binding domain-containing protein, partial [Flavihumibacter sp.]|nr:peptidoglycan-binding domain-containing protein [Flavihumibacter sp.]